MRVLLLSLIVCCSFGSAVAQEKQPEPYDVAEAYEVYAAIIPSEWAVTVQHAKKLVIRAETTADYEMCLKPDPESEKLIGPAIANYVELNKRTWLVGTLQLEQSYQIVFSAELKGIFSQGLSDWKTFYERYPDSGGVISLSAVGFNADKTVAVVYVGHSCGGLCGGGGFNVLQKKEGKWLPLDWKGSSCRWVS